MTLSDDSPTPSAKLTELLHGAMPLASTLGIEAVVADADRVVLRLDWDSGLCTNSSLLHGGAVMALADSAGATPTFLNLPADAEGTATIESKTNFLGGVTEGTVVATATLLHVGSRTIVVETEIRHAGRLVAKTTQTQTVLRSAPQGGGPTAPDRR